MSSQDKVTNLADKRQSLTDISTISGQFRIADNGNRLKCLFWDGMHEQTATGTVELEAKPGLRGALRFPHNIDSQLGTGRIRAQRTTLEFKRPEPHDQHGRSGLRQIPEGHEQENASSRPPVITIRQDVRGVS